MAEQHDTARTHIAVKGRSRWAETTHHRQLDVELHIGLRHIVLLPGGILLVEVHSVAGPSPVEHLLHQHELAERQLTCRSAAMGCAHLQEA